jgi:glycosyltransferase involved in cell wall biosynthesis
VSITVVVPTRNRRATLVSTLQAVLPQAEAVRAEVLVADNGSTDGTPEAVAQATAGRARIVREETAGATRNRNTAARAARGEVLAFVDDDAIPRDGWLANVVAPFADPRVVCVGGRVHLRFASPPPSWWDGSLDDYLAAYDRGPDPLDLGVRPWYESPRGANMAVRRDALLGVGGFNLRLGPRGARHTVGEESDLCLRLLARGGTIRYEPTAAVDHIIDPARLTPAWLFHRAFWNGWSEAIIALAHRPLRKTLGLVRWYYRARALRVPYRPRGEPDGLRIRRECERREALGYVLGVLRHAPVRGRLVLTAS